MRTFDIKFYIAFGGLLKEIGLKINTLEEQLYFTVNSLKY